MSPLAVVAVLCSAALHAAWNFLLKRAAGGDLFIGLSKVAETVLLLPAFAFVLGAMPAGPRPGALGLVAVGALLTLANYVALGRAYAAGRLSTAYPVSRGAMLVFLPALDRLVFGARVGPLGWTALACIVAGIALLHPPARGAGDDARGSARAVPWALLAALAASGYTVWDKRAVQSLPPFVYFYGYTVLMTGAYVAWMTRRHARAEIVAEARAKWPSIVGVALGNALSYTLVLAALRTGTATYVIALRQLSIPLGALLGWRLLGEPMRSTRPYGLLLVCAGALLAAAAGRGH